MHWTHSAGWLAGFGPGRSRRSSRRLIALLAGSATAVLWLVGSASGAAPACHVGPVAAPVPMLGASFGWAAAMLDGRAIIGAYYDSVDADGAGGAYLYLLQGDRHWAFETRLGAPDAQFGDYFGASVALHGDAALIGATGRSTGLSTGTAFLFRRNGAGWQLEAQLNGPAEAEYQGFGHAVALGENLAIVAAFKMDHDIYFGRVFIYQRSPGAGRWSMQAQIGPEHAIEGDLLGRSIALEGDLLVIGALPVDPSPVDPARAYVFRRQSDESWIRAAVLTPSHAAEDDDFGVSVALRGNLALIGAYQDDAASHDSGAAYVFRHAGQDQWVQEARLFPSAGHSHDYAGFSVALAQDTAVLGAVQADEAAMDGGSAFVFRRQSDGTWIETATLTAPTTASQDAFGWSVAADGPHAVVGSVGHDLPVQLSGNAAAFIIAGEDCDTDGSPDACQALLGTIIDANGNGIPDACDPQPTFADLTGDGTVDGLDLAQLLGQWTGSTVLTPCPPSPPADLNGDCRINGLDLAILLGAWTG